MSIEGVDKNTAKLALQLQIDDLDTLKADLPKGDATLAMDLYLEGLISQLQLLNDQIICHSIANAVRDDALTIRQVHFDEKLAASDREMARGMAGIEDDTECRVIMPPSEFDLPADDLRQFEMINMDGLSLEGLAGNGIEENSTDLLSNNWLPPGSDGEDDRLCILCGESAEDNKDISVRASCGHHYCNECIVHLFTAATTDESLFPPRCCNKPIPLKSVRELLTLAAVGKFLAKQLEFTAPNRTYCHDPMCSAFISPQFVREAIGVAVCQRCNKSTCIECKGPMHEDALCPSNMADEQLLSLATEMEWRRCQSCRTMVELSMGCHHMTCRCKAEFCYECGEVWKTCTCAQWRERRLMADARAIVDRDPAADHLDAAERAQQISHMRNYLEVHHECDEHHWNRRRGEFQCSECRNTYQWFIFECLHCRIPACANCRYNRL